MTRGSPATSFEHSLAASWTRRPCVVRGLDDVGPLDVYGIYSRIGAALRAGTHRRVDDVKLFTAAPAPPALGDCLPQPAEDFAGYAARVSRELGADWSVVANSAQAFSPELYRYARDLFIRLRETADGLPAGISDCFVVAGSYATGPTQIHKDTADVFLFVVDGVKTMLLWPYEALSREAPRDVDAPHNYVALKTDPDAVDEQPLRLTGRPGDVLYWPASYWHCAESDGAPSLSLHLATHRYRDMAPLWAGAFARAGIGKTDPRWVSSERELAGPRLVFGREAADAATSALHEWSLSRHSTANFEILPDVGRSRPPDWGSGDVVAAQRLPVSWATDASDPGVVIVAANGRTFRLPHRDTAVALLEILGSLDAGAAVDLAPWRTSTGLDPDVTSVLDVAYVAGAVDIR